MVLSVVRGYMTSCRKDGQVVFFSMQYFVSYLVRWMRVCDPDSCSRPAAAAAQGAIWSLQLPASTGRWHMLAVQRFHVLAAKSWHFACLETSGPAARGTSHGPPAMATRGADPC